METVLANGPDLALVFLSILRVYNGSLHPIVAVRMEVAHEDHAQNQLVLVFAGALVAHIPRSAPGAYLRDPAKELAVFQVDLRLASGPFAVDDLPVSNGVLQFRRELLRAGSSNGNQRQENESNGAEEIGRSEEH